jgi:hypothetical protein
MTKEKKKKKQGLNKMNFPRDGMLVRNHRIVVGVCCDCGMRHAWYFEVCRAKKPIDDEIYIQCEKINDYD